MKIQVNGIEVRSHRNNDKGGYDEYVVCTLAPTEVETYCIGDTYVINGHDLLAYHFNGDVSRRVTFKTEGVHPITLHLVTVSIKINMGASVPNYKREECY